MRTTHLVLTVLLIAAPAFAQAPNDPFQDPIEAAEDVILVGYSEFAALPDVGGERARPMRMVDEPGSGRLFVNDMQGPIYTIAYGGEVTLYLDVNDPAWGIPVEFAGRERGVQSFALHPQFAVPGTAGYGRLYAWLDTQDKEPEPDFVAGGGQDAHDTVLVEFAAGDAGAATYDGGLPRVLLRIEQPFRNHNGGYAAFNPRASAGDPDFGLLYLGVADGGSGGDPLDLAQNLGAVFGKILRIGPLGSDSRNGRYGIPAHNPYAAQDDDRALSEIFASGLRNPQGLAWDPANGNMFVTDIGQNIIEEISLVTVGADLGWNTWEGSYRFSSAVKRSPSATRVASLASLFRLLNMASSTRYCSPGRPRGACSCIATTRSHSFRAACSSQTSPKARSSTCRPMTSLRVVRMLSAGCSCGTATRSSGSSNSSPRRPSPRAASRQSVSTCALAGDPTAGCS